MKPKSNSLEMQCTGSGGRGGRPQTRMSAVQSAAHPIHMSVSLGKILNLKFPGMYHQQMNGCICIESACIEKKALYQCVCLNEAVKCFEWSIRLEKH